jgi:SAM-dependent methyltransferase
MDSKRLIGKMESGFISCMRKWIKAPHPTWHSKESRNRVGRFMQNEECRSPRGFRINIGCGDQRFKVKTFNLDLITGMQVDIQGDLLCLPIKDNSVDTIVCTGVIEHVCDPNSAVKEIHRVLKSGGCAFIETPFMQTYHVSPKDFYRWTPDGLRQLFRNFRLDKFYVTAGPGSAFAWQFQETMAMLFSFNSEGAYKIGLRIFGWLAIPISWLDMLLEKNPMAWRAASGYALVAEKP